jgi:hypothetical protein
MNQENRFLDVESLNVKNAMREVQVQHVNGETFIFLKENVSNGLILQSAQFSDLSKACSAPNDIHITESAVNMCIIEHETSFHSVPVPYFP